MDVRGWVYVISNPAMPGLVKVGFSLKDPSLRAVELDGTGIPHPFNVEYEALVNSPREVEQRAHSILKHLHERKEWFRCAPSIAAEAIRISVSCVPMMENTYFAIQNGNLREIGNISPPTDGECGGSTICNNSEDLVIRNSFGNFTSGFCPKGNRVNKGTPCQECSMFECIMLHE